MVNVSIRMKKIDAFAPNRKYDPKQPFNALPLLPPAGDVETKPVLKACVRAGALLAELRTAGLLIPDQAVLINTIPLLEAKDSSEIENIVTTHDELFREASLSEAESDAATKEALRYRGAVYAGVASLQRQPLTTTTAVDICRTIKAPHMDIRNTPGTALMNTYTGEVIYTPPEGPDLIRDLMANWEQFINLPSDLDPLVRMAIQHYQFEAIHPFTDGNGRTGRIINILSLIQDGLLTQPTLYLSRHILRTRGEYYRLLGGVTARGEWEPWVLYMLTAVAETTAWTTNKIRSIRDLMAHTSMHVARAQQIPIHSRPLIDAIFAQPYCRIAHLTERGIAKRQTASVYLKELVRLGVLQEKKFGRDKLFVNRRYIDLLASDGHDFEPYFKIGPAEAASLPGLRGFYEESGSGYE
jgi:Fic family protein